MKTKILLAGLASMLMASAAHADGTTLNVGMGTADAGTLDPHVATTTPDKGLLYWMFNGLVRITPGQSSPEFIEPDIAESWETSEDGLTWTFKLREDVDCHGEYGNLDAEDVVYSLKRSAKSSNEAPRRSARFRLSARSIKMDISSASCGLSAFSKMWRHAALSGSPKSSITLANR